MWKGPGLYMLQALAYGWDMLSACALHNHLAQALEHNNA